ncbi:hypothetical protein J3Q64DRAFT_1043933 [Phycomyces blakesleeanus]|uniref:Uncharacterized protein n=1 Tax=Phycomyces blakesleeanus TaxID=4837 RepID=A0ABR3BDV3_PHYBL
MESQLSVRFKKSLNLLRIYETQQSVGDCLYMAQVGSFLTFPSLFLLFYSYVFYSYFPFNSLYYFSIDQDFRLSSLYMSRRCIVIFMSKPFFVDYSNVHAHFLPLYFLSIIYIHIYIKCH